MTDRNIENTNSSSDNKTTRLQCKFFILKKNRQCGMTRRADEDYCSEHLILHKKLTNKLIHNGAGNHDTSLDRIPCPLDPKHTIKKSQLKKHLTKCNKFKLKHSNDSNTFYRLDLNILPSTLSKPLVSSDTLNKTVDLLYQIFESGEINELPTCMKQNTYMSATRLNSLSNQKHAIQQSSLIQNLLEYRYTNDLERNHMATSERNLNMLEFGCGKAEFSRYFNQVVRGFFTSASTSPEKNFPLFQIDNFLFIDRGSNRLKFDSKILSDCNGLNLPHIKRLKIDIKDLYVDDVLSREPFSSNQNIVISKHLCGVATDLTLRCIGNNLLLFRSLDSMCIAMCCRHICDPDQYINAGFLIDFLKRFRSTLTYHEFFVTLTKLCSWATNGKRPGVQDCDLVELTENRFVTVKERERIGLMARRVIDEGRLQWVRQKFPHSKADLIRYVSKDISLENVALLLSK